MSSSFDIIAVIQPRPGKEGRVEDLLKVAAAAVKANEPGTLRYHVMKQTKVKPGQAPAFIMLETYKDEQSLGIHAASKDFKALGRAFKQEDLLAEPMKPYFTKEVGGFASKL
ncbi:antibiotic biosynthesis monooxygenase-like protein [Aaosphaeria arxii CBS 175.79]|uniref:Antibiotic biosynthesis monooxygenase-like protein n=1 Tax=Aaosphaeria arxii CBS 175.79 TaxID=1450172 RepID=A0A6A5XCK3_9PLEO|nr:antibiotic biosynthesis monooxygenase-like protein [Aaosphaeria arxii CBS 175.79]KAF2010650.1 antibiotic biosynthesis monooxygenase-like protein [Aaosphaeria arxii CBS 175.79]